MVLLSLGLQSLDFLILFSCYLVCIYHKHLKIICKILKRQKVGTIKFRHEFIGRNFIVIVVL